ncbi:hypothetical protein V7S43_007016 [Phytophthora oleae]|uniref:Uncharacterized protein n=1 Tax=Phytophthora oleae TaxID=2107226 RepID=A0ABD3FN14_9STRA
MAQQVAQLLAESWLARNFILRSGAEGKGGFIQLTNVVGHLAGKARLSDAVMHCALQYVFSHHRALCYTVDPVHVERGEFVFPATAIAAYSHVIVPVFMRALKHWVIQIVTLPNATDDTVLGAKSNIR